MKRLHALICSIVVLLGWGLAMPAWARGEIVGVKRFPIPTFDENGVNLHQDLTQTSFKSPYSEIDVLGIFARYELIVISFDGIQAIVPLRNFEMADDAQWRELMGTTSTGLMCFSGSAPTVGRPPSGGTKSTMGIC